MCKNAVQRHHTSIVTICILCALVTLVPRAECNSSPALDAFFDELDNNHDGAIDANEATQFIGGSIGGQEFDEPQEAADAAASFLHTIDGGDAGLTVSVDELDVHLHSVLSGVRVWEWIRHGVGLSQYADAFRQHSITALDFPVLVQNNGQVLAEELGVRSPFHRSKVVRAIRRQILGLGSPPAEPRLLACSAPVSGPSGPRVAVRWLPPADAGIPPLHRYVLEVAGADGQWRVTAELDDPEPAAVMVDVPPAWEVEGAGVSAGALPSDGGGGGGGVGGVAAARRVLIRVSAWNLYGRSPYGTTTCDLGPVPPPGYPHVSRSAQVDTAAASAAASAAAAANGTTVAPQEPGVRGQGPIVPAPGATEGAAAAADSRAVGAGGAYPRSAVGGLASGAWDAALAAASHAVCSASTAAPLEGGAAAVSTCPPADPGVHQGNMQRPKHGQAQHGPLDRHHDPDQEVLQLLMQQQPPQQQQQQQKTWYGDGGALGGTGGSVVRPPGDGGGGGGADRERSPPPRSWWSSLLLAALPWLLRLLPVPVLRTLVEGVQRRLLWLLRMLRAPPPTWLVQQPPRWYDGALAASAGGGGGSGVAAGPPAQSLAAAALGRGGAGAASSVAGVAHIAGGAAVAAAGPFPTANVWTASGLPEGTAGLPIVAGTAIMASSYTLNDKGRPPPYRLSSAATAPSGLGGVLNEAGRLAALSMANSVGSRGGSIAGGAAIGSSAVSYRGGGSSAIPPRSGSEGDLGTCSSAPGLLSRQLHHQHQHHEQSQPSEPGQPDQLSLRNHPRPFPGSAPALGVLAAASAAGGPLACPQQHHPRGGSVHGGSVAMEGRRGGYGNAAVPGPGLGTGLDAEWADSELQAAIAAGKMCAIPGCRRKLDLRHMRDYLRRHYCGRCQKYVCHTHTAFSPHGDMGSCDHVSSCVCTLCFAQYTPERQRALQKLNKLTQSAASPPLSGQGAAPLAAQSPAQPQHLATVAGPDEAGGKSTAKLMWERAATKLKAVTRFRGKGYRWKRTASMEPVVE